MDDDELPEINAYTSYSWDCLKCGDVNHSEYDPAGEEVKCENCDFQAKVVETR